MLPALKDRVVCFVVLSDIQEVLALNVSFYKTATFSLKKLQNAIVFCNKRLSENVCVDGIILPSAGMTKWFLNAVYFTYLKTVFLLSSVYRLIHYKYAGEQLHNFSRVFFFQFSVV